MEASIDLPNEAGTMTDSRRMLQKEDWGWKRVLSACKLERQAEAEVNCSFYRTCQGLYCPGDNAPLEEAKGPNPHTCMSEDLFLHRAPYGVPIPRNVLFRRANGTHTLTHTHTHTNDSSVYTPN